MEEWLPLVPIPRIRVAVEEYIKKNEITWGELASKLGWYKTRYHNIQYGDSRRLKVTLGMQSYSTGTGFTFRHHMRQATAVHILETIGRDPWEFDL